MMMGVSILCDATPDLKAATSPTAKLENACVDFANAYCNSPAAKATKCFGDAFVDGMDPCEEMKQGCKEMKDTMGKYVPDILDENPIDTMTFPFMKAKMKEIHWGNQKKCQRK